MRTRDLKPGFFRNPELKELRYEARLLFAGLWCMADRRGRLRDEAALIKADIMPYDNVKVEKLIDALAEKRLIIRYEADGCHYIWIPTFLKHQHPHPNEPESACPPCPAEDRAEPVKVGAM